MRRLHEIPRWLGALIFDLEKGATHKYTRRIPTGNPSRPFRYFYGVTGGAGLGHESEIKPGAAFKAKDADQAGHFHVTGAEGDKIKIRHDETKREDVIDKNALRAMLHHEHATSIDAARTKARRDHEDAQKFGSDKQKARAETRHQEIETKLGDPQAEKKKNALKHHAKNVSAAQIARRQDREHAAATKLPKGGSLGVVRELEAAAKIDLGAVDYDNHVKDHLAQLVPEKALKRAKTTREAIGLAVLVAKRAGIKDWHDFQTKPVVGQQSLLEFLQELGKHGGDKAAIGKFQLPGKASESIAGKAERDHYAKLADEEHGAGDVQIPDIEEKTPAKGKKADTSFDFGTNEKPKAKKNPEPTKKELGKKIAASREQTKANEADTKKTGTVKLEKSDSLKAFADKVHEAAASVAEKKIKTGDPNHPEVSSGRFGSGAFIRSVWEQTDGLDFATFQKRLLEASRDGHIALTRADLVGAMHAPDVAASLTPHPMGVGEFHLISDRKQHAEGSTGDYKARIEALKKQIKTTEAGTKQIDRKLAAEDRAADKKPSPGLEKSKLKLVKSAQDSLHVTTWGTGDEAMPTNLVKNPRDEALWTKAKAAARKSNPKNLHALATSIYEKMKGSANEVEKSIGFDLVKSDLLYGGKLEWSWVTKYVGTPHYADALKIEEDSAKRMVELDKARRDVIADDGGGQYGSPKSPDAAAECARIEMEREQVRLDYEDAKSALALKWISYLRQQAETAGSLVKATTGEGSRGGKIIGHTKSGKPVYADSAAGEKPKGFDENDHIDAAQHHGDERSKYREKEKKVANDPDKRAKLKAKADAHGEASAKHSTWSRTAYKPQSDYEKYLKKGNGMDLKGWLEKANTQSGAPDPASVGTVGFEEPSDDLAAGKGNGGDLENSPKPETGPTPTQEPIGAPPVPLEADLGPANGELPGDANPGSPILVYGTQEGRTIAKGMLAKQLAWEASQKELRATQVETPRGPLPEAEPLKYGPQRRDSALLLPDGLPLG